MELPGDMNDLVDGMEKMGLTSFDDLPDDIFIKFFKFLDLPSRLRLRVNKRLDKIHHSVKNELQRINVTISGNECELTMSTLDGYYRYDYCDFNQFETALRGIFNSSVDEVTVFAGGVASEKVACIFDKLSNFDTNHLGVHRYGVGLPPRIPQVTLSTLLTLAENVRDVRLRIVCDSISAQELCILRKIMNEGNCKLKSFYVDTDGKMTKNFLKECFGVTFEDGRRTKIFRATNESVELFSNNVFIDVLTHFKDGLLTTMKQGGFYPYISFRKDDAKPDEKDNVKMNHLYTVRMDLPGNMNDLVDGMEKIEETSFDDLPDDILINIFTLVDLPTRFKLRLNKRLVKIHGSIKMKIKLLKVEIANGQYLLTLDTSDVQYRGYYDFNLLGSTLRGFLNSSVDELTLMVDGVPKGNVACIINLFSQFDANRLWVERRFGDEKRIPQVTLTTLLSLAENIRDIRLEIICDSVSIKDWCTFRKTMVEGDCKLKSFFVKTDVSVRNNFLEECFGITVEDEINEHGLHILHIGDQSVEISSDFLNFLTNSENGILTEVKQDIYHGSLSFKKDGQSEPWSILTKKKADQMVVGDNGKKKAVASDEEERSEISFDDLPDDILINIFSYLDFLSLLKVRLSKRLHKIHRSMKNEFELLHVKISSVGYTLKIYTSDVCYCHNHRDFNQLEKTIRGIFNSSLFQLSISARDKINSVIKSISNFKTDYLTVNGDSSALTLRRIQVNLSTILTLAENVRDARLWITCNSLTAKDLCAIRKKILDDDVKMGTFFVQVEGEMTSKFVKECFDVTIFTEFTHGLKKMFSTLNEFVELFSHDVFLSDLTHFEEGLLTTVGHNSISFRKGCVKPNEEFKVKMNPLYI